ncbi:hypothetical protein [Spirosoma sp.]|uniref:hypothetical protein n=1 Tax=Spirosoma sp. TaxID=1899569 RepID=UPI003B3A6515
MERVLIEFDTPQDKASLLAVLSRFNARVVDNEQAAKQKKFIEIMYEIAAKGGVGDSFGDPSEWQREIRSWDKVLPGREE